jgi:hypothetical protein|tara:strand:- start:1260 stop:1388 length:129 start_codon:yes stop_codon:yes gene_type:complete
MKRLIVFLVGYDFNLKVEITANNCVITTISMVSSKRGENVKK